MGYRYIFITIVLTAYGNLAFKYQLNVLQNIPDGVAMIPFFVKLLFIKPLVMSCVAATVLASISWMAALSRFDLSYAFPFSA